MKLKIIAIAFSALSVTGCISVKSYVDPQYSDLSFESVSVAPETAFNVSTEMLTNGKPNERGSKYLAEATEKLFAKAGVSNLPEATSLKITCNNIADMGDAAAAGFGTGLTFGLAGSSVTDGYEFTFTLTEDGKETSTVYKHAMHTTMGNATAPISNVEAVTPQAAFDAIFEDVFLKFLQDRNGGEMVAWSESFMALRG